MQGRILFQPIFKLLKWRHFKSLTVTSYTQSSCYPAEHSSVGFNDYAEGCSKFTLEKPKHFNFAKDVLEEWANKEKFSGFEGKALWWINDDGEELKLTFTQLLEESNKICNALTEAGRILPKECVIVILPRIPEWWFINVACLKIGAIISPGPVSLTTRDISNRLKASGATTIITTEETTRLVDQISDAPNLRNKFVVESSANAASNSWIPLKRLMEKASTQYECLTTLSDDSMAWFFTSGTTGYPKMTEHTHASYGLAHKITGKYWLDLTSSDIMWNVSDTGWAKSAYSSLFGPWWQGACVFVHDTPRFDVAKTMDVMTTYPVTVTCLPPTAYRLLVQHDLKDVKFKELRHCVSAGEPLNPEVIETWNKQTGLTIREGYGQTEMTLSCGIFRCMEAKPGSMGKASPGYEVQVIDDEGMPLPDDQEGDIAVRCYPQRPVGLFSQYVNDPERTAKVFRGDFYLTGDRGYKDKDGYLWFVGRSDDVIISAGYRIGPFEVESALLEHNAVAESAVVASPCEIRGSIVKAYVVLSSGNAPSEELKHTLQEHVKQTTAPYKYPRRIEFVESLPKTISGKIRRIELRQQEYSSANIS